MEFEANARIPCRPCVTGHNGMEYFIGTALNLAFLMSFCIPHDDYLVELIEVKCLLRNFGDLNYLETEIKKYID